MKLFTTDKTVLMDIKTLEKHPEGMLIHGEIMGTMPVTAVLKPSELRSAFGLLGLREIGILIAMLFRKDLHG